MRRGYLACSLALAALPACSDSSTEFWLPKNDLLPMVALDDRVAYVEKNSATAFLLDPADPSLVPKLAPVGKRPFKAVKHNGSNRLMVLGARTPASTERPELPPTLTIVNPSLLDAQGAASIPLTDQFDGLAQSDDGALAVLYHASSTQAAGDGTLFNPNQMGILTFPADPAGLPTVTAKSIRSLGGVPWTSNPSLSPIQFSPAYVFQGIQRRLAVVLSKNYVTIFDLTDPSRDEISVPLCSADGSCTYSVDQVVFDPSNVNDPTRPSVNIYIRAGAAKDIYQITLTPADPGSTGFPTGGASPVASISMLAVGAAPADMALYPTGAGARLAVVTPDARRLVIIDPKTGGSTAVTIAIPATTIVPFTTVSQDINTPGPQNRAMLVDLQRGSTSVVFVDLGAEEIAGGSSVSQAAIPGAATAVVPLLAQGIAVLLFGKASGNAVLSVVTLVDRPSFFDFGGSSALGPPYLEVRDGGRGTRVWCVDSPLDGIPASNSQIYFRDLVGGTSQASSTIPLDQTITSITALAAPSSDLRRYLVLEQVDPDMRGNVTFLDANNPDRATARTAYGFLFTDYLGRTAP
jgi:hypothetical protein